jgi:hypothetical protein
MSVAPTTTYNASINGFTSEGYGYTSTNPSTLPVGDTMGFYQPCPGDPYTTSLGFSIPSHPICPDINGNIITDPNYPNYTTATRNSYYGSNIPQVNYQNFYLPAPSVFGIPNWKVFCPDYCVTTRAASPDPTIPVVASQPVNSFQTATCPDGYHEVSSFNRQPAIEYQQTPQTLTQPMDWYTYTTQYQHNPVYACSPWYTSWNNMSIWFGTVQPLNAPYYNTTPVNTGAIYSDYTESVCSAQTSNVCNVGADPSPPQYGVDTQLPDGKAGQWVNGWTWTPFWNLETQAASGPSCWFAPIAYSYSDSSCNTLGSSYYNHYDKYYHNARYIRCQYAQPYGWFYTSALEPISRLCARDKPTWQQTSP